MWNYRFAAFLLSLSAFIYAEEQTVPLFSYAEWREIYSKRLCPEDFVVLVDGKKIGGTLIKVPAIEYAFGDLEFDPSQIATINVAFKDPLYKIQYISREGQNFVGTLSKGKFVLWVNEPNAKNPYHLVRREIDPKIVNFVLLKSRNQQNLLHGDKLSTIEFKNGDCLPAILWGPILLSNGWKEKPLHPETIVELCCNGNLHGQVVENGVAIDLDFLFVKDRFLTVQIPFNNQTFHLPWDQIERVQARNGGFIRSLKEDKTVILHAKIHDLEEAIQAGIQTTAPDSIGNTSGEALALASAGMTVLPDAIKELARLGTERLIGLEPLFAQEKEENWVMEIDFEDPLDPNVLYAIHEALIIEHLPKEEMKQEVYLPLADLPGKTEPEPLPSIKFESVALVEELLPFKSSGMATEEEEEILTPATIAMIKEILGEEEDLGDVWKIKRPLLPVETQAPLFPEETERLVKKEIKEEALSGKVDLIWDPVSIDLYSKLTDEEASLLDDLLGK